MSYSKINWTDSPSTTTPVNATNLNKMDNQIYTNTEDIITNANNITALETAINRKTIPSKYSYTAGGSVKSVSSTFANLGDPLSFEVKKGNAVIAALHIGGLYISNTGYSIQADIKVDNTTLSDSGTFGISPRMVWNKY